MIGCRDNDHHYCNSQEGPEQAAQREAVIGQAKDAEEIEQKDHAKTEGAPESCSSDAQPWNHSQIIIADPLQHTAC